MKSIVCNVVDNLSRPQSVKNVIHILSVGMIFPVCDKIGDGWVGGWGTCFNPSLFYFLGFLLGNNFIYFQFHSNTKMARIVEILLRGKQPSVYPAWPITWLLMTWRRKEPGHHQPCYWPTFPGISRTQRQKDYWYLLEYAFVPWMYLCVTYLYTYICI